MARKPRPGRPSKRTAEATETILRCLQRGLTLETAAYVAGIHPDTMRRWRRTDKEFEFLIDQAQHKGYAFVAENGMRLVAKGNASMVQFYLSRKVPGFRAKDLEHDQEHSYEDMILALDKDTKIKP